MARRFLLALAVLTTAALTAATTTSAHAKPAPKPRLSAQAVTVLDNGVQAVVALKLSKKATKTVKVAWATKDGTALAGSDYTKSSGTVTIKKGKRTGTITVPILDDTVYEATEAFTVTLASKQATGAGPVTVTITDNDPTPGPTAPSALAGTITAVQTSADPLHPARSVVTTFTMTVRLVPTATPGQWRDDGSGSWTIRGSGYETVTEDVCSYSAITEVSDTGTFLKGAGAPATKQGTLLLSGFDPAGATGAPLLAWAGTSAARRTAPNFCRTLAFDPGTWAFGQSATGGYTGTPGTGRGVRLGVDAPGQLTVTGSLTPVA